MIELEVDSRLANKANKRKRAELYEKKGKVVRRDPSKRVRLTLEQESVQKICLFEKYSHKKFYSFVMNEAKLTAEQRSRLLTKEKTNTAASNLVGLRMQKGAATIFLLKVKCN